MLTGSTPQERDPDGRAGSELGALFQFISDITAPAPAAVA
jgi:hypothetical protein